MNGQAYFKRRMSDEDRDGVVVAHGNFIVGYREKIDAFKKFGLWALEGDDDDEDDDEVEVEEKAEAPRGKGVCSARPL